MSSANPENRMHHAFESAARSADQAGAPRARETARLVAPGVPTFAEVPRGTLDELPADTRAVVVGAPYEGYIARDRQVVYAPGTVPLDHHDLYSRSGAFEAPNAIRQGSVFYSIGHSNGYLIERSVELGTELPTVDVGNLDVYMADDETAISRISHATRSITEKAATPIVLGGDHSVSFPSVSGIAQASGKRIGVISMDAHLDLSWAPHFSHSSQWARLMELGILDPHNFVLVGSRGTRNSRSWLQVAENLGISYHTMASVDELGIEEVMKRAVDRALDGVDTLYLSIDIDVMDPASCPAQKYPDAGGLTTREAIRAVKIVSEAGLCGMDLCCLGPAYDVGSLGSIVAARLIVEAMSGMAVSSRA